ncbi:MAG: HNH endonuclease family protein, partial [Tannerellaceae bacterium]|nr:HNH endonuclease family protein [Tannerellaceae bacterium]
IHAQNSESLKTNQEWKDWLFSHQSALKKLQKSCPQLSQEIESVLSEEEPVLSIKTLLARIDSPTYHGSIREDFKIVSEKVIRLLSEDTDGKGFSQMHSLSNMALLSGPCNSALKNSTFDVKRTRIIEMDRHGEYIPQCTRNVFLKYYSDSDTKIHFWSHSDREAYIQAINDVLFSRKDTQGKEKTLNLLKQRINYGRR